MRPSEAFWGPLRLSEVLWSPLIDDLSVGLRLLSDLEFQGEVPKFQNPQIPRTPMFISTCSSLLGVIASLLTELWSFLITLVSLFGSPALVSLAPSHHSLLEWKLKTGYWMLWIRRLRFIFEFVDDTSSRSVRESGNDISERKKNGLNLQKSTHWKW